ncbi:MAG: prolipoprotein diacylglyceryl transferase [Patescibacteria group bacterium]
MKSLTSDARHRFFFALCYNSIMNFLHYFQPEPVLLSLGPITIRWYGLLIAIALAVSLAIALKLAEKRRLKIDDLLDLALWLVIGGIIGARLYDVLIVDWPYFSSHLIEVLSIWQGGLAIHGALIGGLAALIIWCRRRRQNFWLWLDVIAVVLPLAQAIGRWGNYFNSELFGGPTDLPWGILISEKLRPLVYQSSQYFHPVFLYESILDSLLFAILFVLFKRNNLKIGQLAGWYFVGYGLIRFLTEFIRIDPTGMVAGVRAPQLASVFLVIIGLTIVRLKSKQTHQMF